MEIWKDFLPAHWMFFPLELGREQLYSLQAPPERVLPWESEEVLVPGDAAKILKVEVPESYFELPDVSHWLLALKHLGLLTTMPNI
jgi:hypothetical protein